MDFNDIIQIGSQLFQSKLDQDGDGTLELSEIGPALAGLFANQEGKIDLASVVSSMNAGGLMSLVQSWLSDGPNDPVEPGQVASIFGADKIAAFAEQLGISKDAALKGLAQAVPAVVDNSSKGGSLLAMGDELLQSVGGVSGVLNMAGKLFGNKA
jgi:uncharacterized protein YidB (DUF937 family)